MGNTKTVTKTQLKTLWNFPELRAGNSGRVVTKHFMNLIPVLDSNYLNLLAFLVYQSELDNTIKYSMVLFKKYTAFVKLIGNKKLKTSEVVLRRSFKYLLENGLLLHTSVYNVFMINPALTYSKAYVRGSFYALWLKTAYQQDLVKAVGEFQKHVKSNL